MSSELETPQVISDSLAYRLADQYFFGINGNSPLKDAVALMSDLIFFMERSPDFSEGDILEAREIIRNTRPYRTEIISDTVMEFSEEVEEFMGLDKQVLARSLRNLARSL